MRGPFSKLGVLALLAFALMASGALAYFTTAGTGSGSGSTASLSKPVVTVPATSGGDISVSWSASTLVPSNPAGNSLINYTVERSANGGSSWTPACGGATINGTSCNDAVGSSGNYVYRVIAHLNSWSVTSDNSSSVARRPARPVVSNATGVATIATVTGTAESGSNVKLYTDSTCTTAAVDALGNPGASGTATGGSFSIQATVPAAQTTTFWATSTANSLTSDCSTTSAAYTPVALGPTVNRALIIKAEQVPNTTAGHIRQNSGYSVYADITPAAGSTISSVRADLSSISGASNGNVALGVCSSSCTVNGQTYSHFVSGRSSSNPLAAGTKGFAITATDSLSRSATHGDTTAGSALTVNVDNTRPNITSVATSGDGDGVPEAGETITLNYDSAMEGASFFSAWVWPFAAANVRVTFTDRNTNSDRVSVTAGSTFATAVPTGTIDLGANGYVTGGNNDTVFFGGTGATQNSTVDRSGNSIVITLGAQNGGDGGALGSAASSVVTWSGGNTGVYDAAGNPVTNSPSSVATANVAQF